MSALMFSFLNFFCDEDEEEEIIPLWYARLQTRNHTARIQKYYEDTIPRYTDYDFQSHFRVSRSTMEHILYDLKPYVIEKKGRLQYPLEKQLMITMWYLGNQEVFRSIADRFNVAKSTAHESIYRVIDILITNLGKQLIKWPNVTEATTTSNFFREKDGFPDVIGCIDGTHIPIATPYKNQESYVNRKGYHSLILQGVCNEKKMFIDISCGWPGSMHDARVLRKTDLGKTLMHGQNNEDNLFTFYNNMHLLGDSAYPVLNNLLTPYKDNGNLNERQKLFNRKLSSSRIYIEHTFGLLKARFRCLKHLNVYNTILIPKVIFACCILHNICVMAGDTSEVDLEDNEVIIELELPVYENESGNLKRNYIASLF